MGNTTQSLDEIKQKLENEFSKDEIEALMSYNDRMNDSLEIMGVKLSVYIKMIKKGSE